MTSAPVDGAQLLTSTPKRANGSTSTSPDEIENVLLQQLLKQKEDEENAKKWASWVDGEYTKCKNARQPFERQWYINLAFHNSKHYLAPVEIAGQGFRLTPLKSPPHRVRLTINKCRTIVRREVSKLTSSKPIPTVVPSSNEMEDFSAAQVGESLIRSQFGYAEFESAYRAWIWSGTTFGVSFLKQWWDGAAKDWNNMVPPPAPVVPGPDGQPVPAPQEIIQQRPDLQEYMQQLQPAQGKICLEKIDPFYIYVPDLLTKDLEKQPYVIQVMTRHPEWVKKAFNLPNVQADARAATTLMDAASLVTKGMEDHLDSVLVKEVWIKPGFHPDFPEGGVLTVVNSRVVQQLTKWPLPYPEYPFYKFDGIDTGGFYSDSILVDAIPLNKEINKARSQAAEIRNTMGKPKFFYQEGSITPRKVSSEPGQMIGYRAGFQPPVPINGVEVPNTFYNEIAQSQQDLDDLSGQHEISRGTTPKDVTSGTAITFLEEQDTALLSSQVASIEHGIENLGKHYLHLVSTYWDDSRVIKVTGRNNEFEAITWKKGALRGNLDVRVQTGSALPFSKAAKQAMITEWMQMGILPPETGMEILEMADMTRVVDEMLVDKKQAQRENLKMADLSATPTFELLLNPAPFDNPETGETVPPQPMDAADPKSPWMNGDGTPFQPQPPVPVNSWDDHDQHIFWHNQFRKTQEFELLPDANKKAFELHVQLHQMAGMANMVNTRGQVVQESERQQNINNLPPGENQEDPNGEQDPSNSEGGGDGSDTSPTSSDPSQSGE